MIKLKYATLAIFFVLIVIGAYMFGKTKNNFVQSSVYKTVYVSPTSTPTPMPTLTLTPTPTTTSISKSDEKWQRSKQEAGDKVRIVDSEDAENEIFKKSDIVRMKSGLVVEFINNSHTIQPYYPNSGETYIADISLINLGHNMKSQYIFFDNFQIQDSYGRTYKPYLSYKGEGDVTGELKPLEYKRGEMCFITPLQNIKLVDYVPKYSNNVSYTLKIITEDETIEFKMNNQKEQEP